MTRLLRIQYPKEVSRYIHLNPVRIKKYAGMEPEQRIRLLNGFTQSSFGGYTILKKRDDFIHVDGTALSDM
jgi:hypothetical protein